MKIQPYSVQIPYGNQTLLLSTGGIARQAGAAVTVQVGDTMVLVTVVVAKSPRDGVDFLPLTVEFQERAYAGGRIPGGFFRREGRPSEGEILVARLIDRPVRPLFPDHFRNEIQIVATVLSLDPDIDAEIPAMIGASAALKLSGAPFAGPIGAARVGYCEGEYILNPTRSQRQSASKLDLVVAGTREGVLMVESEAKDLGEDVMLGAVAFGHRAMQAVIDAIHALHAECGKPQMEVPLDVKREEIRFDLLSYDSRLRAAIATTDKGVRSQQLSQIRNDAVAALCIGDAPRWTPGQIKKGLHDLEAAIVRNNILDGHPRIDGRDTRKVRPLSMHVGVLPRAHGSAIFTRGETQVLAVTTLGTGRDAQMIDSANGVELDPFMLHYNFPPYCVGETGRLMTKRREIGHGRLARRALQAVMPDLKAEFPYVVRVVSETTESNGSSSMATVCGGCLSLMEAGVPIKAPVAGIAMGLILEGARFAVLTDILGDEDHLGDMDFKVAGTRTGITALQMDIKITSVTIQIMEQALAQAREARLHILDQMQQVLAGPRQEPSRWAPRITTIKIDPDKIREVIGKGGSVIQALQRDTGTVIEIDDDGSVRIAATSGEGAAAALARINAIIKPIAEGDVFEGPVVKLMDFGAFVTLAPGKDGLVHISQLSHTRVDRAEDAVKLGDIVRVKVMEVDRQGRIRLSIKALTEPAGAAADAQ